MEWEKPEFTEVKMDAEIGSYQLVDGDRDVAPHVEDDTNGNTWWGDYQGLAGASDNGAHSLRLGPTTGAEELMQRSSRRHLARNLAGFLLAASTGAVCGCSKDQAAANEGPALDGATEAAPDAAQESGACLKDQDCDGGQQCGYALDGGCGALRQCFSACPPLPPAFECACNGTRINIACGFSAVPATPNSGCLGDQ